MMEWGSWSQEVAPGGRHSESPSFETGQFARQAMLAVHVLHADNRNIDNARQMAERKDFAGAAKLIDEMMNAGGKVCLVFDCPFPQLLSQR